MLRYVMFPQSLISQWVQGFYFVDKTLMILRILARNLSNMTSGYLSSNIPV